MIEREYYNSTIRKYTAAFGSIFNGIRIAHPNGTIGVPLVYSSKEAFVARALSLNSIDNSTTIKESLPRMGFSFEGMVYAPNRKLHTLNKICNEAGDVMFNRTPYDYTFELSILTRKIDDLNRIAEQVLPYFSPSLNLKIKELSDYPNLISDIPLTLNGITFTNDSEGEMNDRRIVMAMLSFTLSGWLYAESRVAKLINTAVIEFNNDDGFLEGSVCLPDGTTYNLTESYEDSKNKIFTGAHSEGELDV